IRRAHRPRPPARDSAAVPRRPRAPRAADSARLYRQERANQSTREGSCPPGRGRRSGRSSPDPASGGKRVTIEVLSRPSSPALIPSGQMHPVRRQRKNVLDLDDFSVAEIEAVLETAAAMKDVLSRPIKKVPT